MVSFLFLLFFSSSSSNSSSRKEEGSAPSNSFIPSFPRAPSTSDSVRVKCREMLSAALRTGGELCIQYFQFLLFLPSVLALPVYCTLSYVRLCVHTHRPVHPRCNKLSNLGNVGLYWTTFLLLVIWDILWLLFIWYLAYSKTSLQEVISSVIPHLTLLMETAVFHLISEWEHHHKRDCLSYSRGPVSL